VVDSVVACEIQCPVCGADTVHQEVAPDWGEFRSCTDCTLEFAYPLQRGQDPRTLFDDAYRGQVTINAMDDFRRRVDQRRVILDQLREPQLWFWTPAFGEVLSWLKRHYPPGSTILEIGCGLGFFLHALRQEGFEAVGLDVAETVVDINRKDGFPVWHGPVESLRDGWVAADAVVAFFMLHHLEDPLTFLRTIRQRAPDAGLALAVYGPSNKGEDASFPPRTLIRWNARALATALRLAEYEAVIHDLASTGSERGLVRWARATLGHTSGVPWLYRFGKRLEQAVLRCLPADARQESYVVLALAQPRVQPPGSA
jgi:2-polyprenyl-3-methyl-5-hydroxy-6-metoxy-1,4-benzoquinol methylase